MEQRKGEMLKDEIREGKQIEKRRKRDVREKTRLKRKEERKEKREKIAEKNRRGRIEKWKRKY